MTKRFFLVGALLINNKVKGNPLKHFTYCGNMPPQPLFQRRFLRPPLNLVISFLGNGFKVLSFLSLSMPEFLSLAMVLGLRNDVDQMYTDHC